MLKEMTVEVRDLKEGDLVLGTDGEWHEMCLLPIEKKDMYEVITSNGTVKCSYDHQWTVFDYSIENSGKTLKTIELVDALKDRKTFFSVGVPDGPALLAVRPCHEAEECRCLEVDSEDHQFAVLTDEDRIVFTHNCQGRMLCGRVNGTASMMALGNSLGTAIDNSKKGAGIVNSAGIQSNVRYYYVDPKDITKWFNDRGLDDKGYPLDAAADAEEEVINLYGEEEIELPHDKAEYDFEEIHKEVNLSKDQKFENV